MPMFDRAIEVIIGQPGTEGIKLTETFHITGKFKAGSGTSANEGQCTISGLTESTIQKMQKPGTVCIIKAGYKQDSGAATFYAGTIMRIEKEKEEATDNVVLFLMDSVIPLRDAKISCGFPGNTSALKILDYVAAQFGLPVRKNLKIEDRQMTQKFAFNGRAKNAMNEICDFLGLEWSAQKNEIQIIKKGNVYSDTAVLLSSATGLIGSPKPISKNLAEKDAGKKGIKYGQDGVVRFTKTDPNAKIKERQMFQVQGYKVRSLMNPGIYPGALIKLVSSGIDGKFFRVEECAYSIASEQDEMTIEAELRIIDGQ